jgi:Mn2+/Fe2+ NRAMP family transporter
MAFTNRNCVDLGHLSGDKVVKQQHLRNIYMSFFQTTVLFFGSTVLIGVIITRYATVDLSLWHRLIYPVLALSIFVLIGWTIVQMLFGLPKFDTVFPITAILLGVLFAVGIKGAYITLKQRKAKR